MKLQVPFVQLPLQFDADVLSREVLALGADAWREHPQKFPGNHALPLISVDGDPDSDSISGPMRPTAYLAQCPYLMQVLAGLDAVWGRDVYVDERTVDVHVGRLRKCLKRGREIDPIRTVRGMGYSFDERFGRS